MIRPLVRTTLMALVAGISSAWLLHPGATDLPHAPALPSLMLAEAAWTPPRTEQDYLHTLRTKLFGVVPEDPSGCNISVDPKVALKGVVVTEPAELSVAFVETAGKTQVLQAGQQIAGAEVTGIRPDGIWLKVASQGQWLPLHREPLHTREPRPPTQRRPQDPDSRDIVHSINGVTVESPEMAQALIQRFQGARRTRAP